MNRTSRFVVFMLSIVGLWTASATATSRNLVFHVALRQDVSNDIAVTIRENPNDRACRGQTILLIHGLAHTASTWNPFVDSLFARRGSKLICRVAAVDLPGHGLSAVPDGAPYGSLLIDDYVTAVLGVVDGLKAQSMSPHGIIAHSLGGLIVESMQARLLESGTSLARRYNVFWAMLLSPVYAREQPWAFADSGQALPVLAPLVVDDGQNGLVARFPAAVWRSFFFTNFSQLLSPGVPTIDDITARGYDSDESFAAAAELIGLAPMARVSVGSKPFALRHGTLLFYVNPSQDSFNWRDEAKAAYVQLTGDTALWGFLAIDDPNAVHDMYLAQPALLLSKIRAALIAPL